MGGFSCAPRCPAFLTFRDSPALSRQESDGYPVRPASCYPDADRPSPPLRSPLEFSGPRQAARRWASAPHAPAPSAPHAPATVGLRRCQGCHRGQSFNVLWLGPTFQCTLARDPGVRRYYVRRRVQKWRPFWLPDVRLSVNDTATQWHVVPHKASRDTPPCDFWVKIVPIS